MILYLASTITTNALPLSILLAAAYDMNPKILGLVNNTVGGSIGRWVIVSLIFTGFHPWFKLGSMLCDRQILPSQGTVVPYCQIVYFWLDVCLCRW